MHENTFIVIFENFSKKIDEVLVYFYKIVFNHLTTKYTKKAAQRLVCRRAFCGVDSYQSVSIDAKTMLSKL